MKLRKILALLCVVAMFCGVMAGCGDTQKPTETVAPTEAPATETPENTDDPGVERAENTLVVGYSNFSEKFSPFFAESGYDQDVSTMTALGMLSTDRDGAIIYNGIEGETIPYNGTDYFYDGIADCDVKINDDGSVVYSFTMRDDIVFSDGTPMTADDAIFTMYVLCDPTYDGGTTLFSQPIVGVEEYRNSMAYLYNLILSAGEDNTDFSLWTEEQQTAYWTAFKAAGEQFAQEIVDYCVSAGFGKDSSDVATAASAWGFTLAADATAADFFAAIFEQYGVDLSANGIDKESAGSSISDLIDEQLTAAGEDPETYKALTTVADVANIAGIEKTGDYSFTVTTTKYDATTIYQLGFVVAPLHYYGDTSMYDYDNNSFGFKKGDLSSARSVTTKPMGAGPYKFVSYENGVVTFESNENYYKGCPKIKYILFQEVTDADKLTGLATGSLDISDPTISAETVSGIEGYNSNGELTGDMITTDLVDNLGYGYIGIQAENVSVGGVSGSEQSKDLRKAFATLFAVYRDAVINSYYGERAAVIQYPISNTSWAAPKPADDGYQIAFSTDVDGNPIYTDGMTDDEKYAAALDAAIGFLKAAGYTWDEATGTFTAAPEGAKMAYELQIPGDGVGDHPVFGVVTNASTALKTIGIDLQINDLSNSAALWDGLSAGTVDMWCAAWSATVDPDMYQVYHSSNNTGSNHYRLFDTQLDELIMAARTSADTSYRKATYKQCLDIILDWACEVPTYQRKNCILFSTERVNMDTVTPDITTFWGWNNDLEKLELN